MFRPLMRSSSGRWEQEHKCNYTVSKPLHSLKIIQFLIEIHNKIILYSLIFYLIIQPRLTYSMIFELWSELCKGKVIPLQAQCGPDGG